MQLKRYIVYMVCELEINGLIETFDTEEEAINRCNEFSAMFSEWPMCGQTFYLSREDFLSNFKFDTV